MVLQNKVTECRDNWLINIPEGPSVNVGFIFAHGAGAGKDHWFMESVAEAFCALGIAVIRFDFPYMQKIRATGTRRPPDKMNVLVDCFKETIRSAEKLYPNIEWSLAGKSLGGRVATHVIADSEYCRSARSKALRTSVCLGYPFHPPKKPESLRVENLNAIDNPVLIFQGTRDIFGTLDEVEKYSLNTNILVHWLDDGDHDLHPRKSSGYTFEQHMIWFTNCIHEYLTKGIS